MILFKKKKTCEDFFEKIIKAVTDDYEDIKEIVDKAKEYCDDKKMKEKSFLLYKKI